MERLFQTIIAADNFLLDQLFQPLVDHCPIDRMRAKPAVIAMLPLILVIGVALWNLWAASDRAWFSNEFIAPGLDILAWIAVTSANQGLIALCVGVAKDQRPGHLHWFRVGGFVFRIPILLATIIAIVCWGGGVVPGLWWIATCFMGCNSAPPMVRQKVWVPG